MMTGPILEDVPFNAGDNVLAFVNGMGGTPLIELYVVFNKVARDPGGTRRQDHPQPYRATTSPRSRWRAARSRCSSSTTSSPSYWDAPVNTPGPALGVVQ